MTTPIKSTIGPGSVLTNDDVTTETGTPHDLQLYAHDVHGPGGVVRGTKRLLAGEFVRFAACDRNIAGGPPVVKELWPLKLTNGGRAVRFCTVDGDSDGPGTYTLVGGSTSEWPLLTEPEIAANIAWRLSYASQWSFLLP